MKKMKKLFLTFILVMSPFAGPLFAQQAVADMVQAGIDAYNKQDIGYFEKMLAPDVVWLDDDGHALSGKDRVLGFLRGQLSATPTRKLTITNVRTGSSIDAAWVSFAYTMDGGPGPRKGLNSTVYRKSGNDWQIVLVHGAINTPGHGH